MLTELLGDHGRPYTYTWGGSTALGIIAVATIGLASRDVGEALVCVQVNQGVQEAEGRLAISHTGVVEKGNDSGSDWGGCGGTSARSELAALEDRVAVNRYQIPFMSTVSNRTYSGVTLWAATSGKPRPLKST